MMQIQGITLREISMKLVVPFETSMDRLVVRRIVLLEAHVDGVTGWGECVAAEAPFYSPEYADTAWPVLRDFLWPMVKGRKFDSACEVWNLLTRVRGHNMAKACLEAAAWDAEAKQKGVPLAKLIGGTREEIASGVSIGIKDSVEELVATVKKELAAGYQQDQDQAGKRSGARRTTATGISTNQADGGCQFRVHARGLPALEAARWFLPDDVGATARLG
jgi:o-succinylbenzoate synthase